MEDWVQIQPLVFTRSTRIRVDGPADRKIRSHLLGSEIDLENLVFMDTETTGLSGGAGTLVFLVGDGIYRDGEVTVTQTFVADFPGEPAFIDAVEQRLAGAPVWVSYNGKAFDSHLLQTRFLMNGRRIAVPEQLDLLYWARRLWRRRIGGCRLEDVERDVLGLQRELDVPSFEIPDRYFGFLDSGSGEVLTPVFAHHLQDIVSLVRLFFRVESLLDTVHEAAEIQEQTTQILDPDYDRAALARYLAVRNFRGVRELLHAVVYDPYPGESMHERERCALALSQIYRREGRIRELGRAWERLWQEGSERSGLELAKYLEHQERRLDEAREIVETLLTRELSPGVRDLLEHRLARLRRKIAS